MIARLTGAARARAQQALFERYRRRRRSTANARAAKEEFDALRMRGRLALTDRNATTRMSVRIRGAVIPRIGAVIANDRVDRYGLGGVEMRREVVGVAHANAEIESKNRRESGMDDFHGAIPLSWRDRSRRLSGSTTDADAAAL
jgi:hypothetical protein